MLLLSLWLTTKGEAAGERRPRRRRRSVPRAPEHPGRPHVPFTPPYLKTTTAPAGCPETLTTQGRSPCRPTPSAGGEVEGEKGVGRGAARGEADRR
jgi:hypothetical protein